MIAPADRWRSGAVMVEFAMLILPFITLVFGVIEYARMQWTRSALQEVALAGARCAGLQAVGCTLAATSGTTNRPYNAAATRAFIRAQAANWYIGLPPNGVAVTNNTTCNGAANFVRVSVTYTFSSPFLAPIRNASWPVTAVACFPNQT